MPNDTVTKGLLACGLIGAPLFVAVFLIDGATRSGYDPMYHPVSALSLGERGAIQITNFLIMGLLLLLFAFGLRRALHPGHGSRWTPALMGLVGISLIGAGVFVTDPYGGYPPGTVSPPEFTLQGMLHNVFSLIVFVALSAAALVMARRALRTDKRQWAVYDGLTGIAVLALFVASADAFQRESDMGGAIQRATIVIGWVWIAVLALRLLNEGEAVRARTKSLESRSQEAR